MNFMNTEVNGNLISTLNKEFDFFMDSGDASFPEKRRESFEKFKKLGFPTRRNEDWKYTGVNSFLNGGFSIEPENTHDANFSADDFHIPKLECYEFFLVNGVLQNNNIELPSYIKLSSIKMASSNDNASKAFGNDVDNDAAFAALNTALFKDGFLIEIDKNASVDKPLHFIHYFSGKEKAFVQPRNMVIVNSGASLSLVESFVSQKENSVFINNLTEVNVHENSFVDHYVLQNMEAGTQIVNQTDVSCIKGSVYNNYTFSLPGSELIRNNLHVHLNSSGSEAHLFGLYLGNSNQLIDNHSMVNHKYSHCDSNEIYKGVLLDNATGVFNGKIFVQHDAQKTNAFQQNNNLLLSKKAAINTKPQLEIFADDVKCSHGTTIGQLSGEALFYLKSRGLSDSSARALLVNAFAFDVTDKMKIPELKEFIETLVAGYIPAENL